MIKVKFSKFKIQRLNWFNVSKNVEYEPSTKVEKIQLFSNKQYFPHIPKYTINK